MEDTPRYEASGRPYPKPNGPDRLWRDVPPAERATGENVARHYAVVGWKSPANLEERCRSEDEYIKRHLERRDNCAAAVRWYSTNLWRPCPWIAMACGLCWKHGGWRFLNMARTRSVDLTECDGPEATVEIKVAPLRLDNMARQLARLKKAAEDMGAPSDSLVKIDTYGEHTRAVVRWRA